MAVKKGMLEIVLEAPNKISVTLPPGRAGKPVLIKRYVSSADLLKVISPAPADDRMTVPGWENHDLPPTRS